VTGIEDVFDPVAAILSTIAAIFNSISPSGILLCRGLRVHRSREQDDRRNNVSYSTHTGLLLALGFDLTLGFDPGGVCDV
jgi:hypothetical protein